MSAPSTSNDDVDETRGTPRLEGAASERSRRSSTANRLNAHLYPRFLHSSPFLFRAFHWAVHCTTLRNWYVARAIRRLPLEGPGPSIAVLDVGCGAGDHLYYADRRTTRATFVGIDRSPEAVSLCRAHAPNDGRMRFWCRDVECARELPEADVILCITVLQYIRNDDALLSAIRSALRDGGKLLLYVPVRNDRLLSSYDRVVTGSRSDYDAAQDRKRVYQPDDIERLLRRSGFTIERSEQAYGSFGKLAFELHALALHGATHDRRAVRMFAAAAGLTLLPVLLGLMALDYLLPVSRGNGLLIEAR